MPPLERPSPNHDARPEGQPVDILLLHYTGMPSAAAALQRMCDAAAKVSAHYLIDEDGSTYALVPEVRRAWHAGVACWAGARDINARSIGIELVNPGHEWGYRDFPPAQMLALDRLAVDILRRHPIPPARVLGHADVAPTRKQDPGERFDWAWLSARGIGLWPGERPDLRGRPADAAAMAAALTAFGYDVADPSAAIVAFQRHFRQAVTDGTADAECLAVAEALTRACGGGT